jgi:hypothetical protein
MSTNNSTSITKSKIFKSITMYQQRINCLIDHQFPNDSEIRPKFSTKKNYHNTQMTLITPTKTKRNYHNTHKQLQQRDKLKHRTQIE